MSFVNKGRNKLDNVKIKSMGELLGDVLKATSGTSSAGVGDDFRIIFNKVIGFRGVRDGLGTSLFVSNLAVALASQGMKICVVDTSMLYPVQDTYLKTKIKYFGANESEVRDWFDLMYDDKDVLNITDTYPGVVVLSFTGRNLTDLTSISDTLELGQAAIDKVSPKFDLVLVDIANEYTSVGLAAMQACDVIYQVLSNDRASLISFDAFVSNMLTQAIPYNKMQQVILLSTIDGIMQSQSIDDVLKKYGFVEVARVGLSEVIASENAVGRLAVTTKKIHEDIEEYKMAVAKVAKLILNIDDMDKEIAGIKVSDLIEENADVGDSETPRRGRGSRVQESEPEYYEDEDYDYDDEEVEVEEEVEDRGRSTGRGRFGRRSRQVEEPSQGYDSYDDDYSDEEGYSDSDDYLDSNANYSDPNEDYSDPDGDYEVDDYEDDSYYDDGYYDENSYDDYEEEPVKKGRFGSKSKGTTSKKRGLFGSKKSKGR